MKEKIRSSIVNKYSKFGYSKKAVEAVVDYIEESITEESEIDAAVDKVGPLLKSFQSEIGRLASEKKKTEDEEKAETERLAKEEADKLEKEKTPAGGGSEASKETEGLKALLESYLKPISDQLQSTQKELAAIKTGKTVETRKQILDRKLEKLPDSVKTIYQKNFDKMTFKDEADFEEWSGEVDAQLTGITTQLTAEAFGGAGKPGGTPAGSGGGAGAPAAKATKEEIDTVVNGMNFKI